MPIKLDISPSSVVVHCSDCPHWNAFAWTVLEGHDTAQRHEERVHPDADQARKAAEKYRLRHAGEPGIVSYRSETRHRGNPKRATADRGRRQPRA